MRRSRRTRTLLELTEVAPLPRTAGTSAATALHWDVLGLYREIARPAYPTDRRQLAGIGIDSWAVDYGLLDSSGALLGNPVHYRDARTDGGVERC